MKEVGLRHKHPVLSISSGSSLRVTELRIYVGQSYPMTHTESIFVVVASKRTFSLEPMGLHGAILWLMRWVTGDSNGECPAADQEEQGCAEQSLGRSSAQGK